MIIYIIFQQSLTLPFTAITDQTKQDPLWPLYDGLTDADVKAFYEVAPDLKAIFLTDTGTWLRCFQNIVASVNSTAQRSTLCKRYFLVLEKNWHYVLLTTNIICTFLPGKANGTFPQRGPAGQYRGTKRTI